MEPPPPPPLTQPLSSGAQTRSPPTSLARNNTVAAVPVSFSPSRRASDGLVPGMPSAAASSAAGLGLGLGLGLPSAAASAAAATLEPPTTTHSEFVIEGASESQFDFSSSSDDDDDHDHDHDQGHGHHNYHKHRTGRPAHRSHSRTSQWSTSSSASSFVSIASQASWAPPVPAAAMTASASAPPPSTQGHTTADSATPVTPTPTTPTTTSKQLLQQHPLTPTIVVTDPSPSKPNSKPASKSSSTSTSVRTHTHSASVSSSGTATSLSFAGPIPTAAHPHTQRASILSTSTSTHHVRHPPGTTTPSTTPHMAPSALGDPAGVWRPDVARDTALALHECSIRAFALVHDAHWPMHPLPVPVPRGKAPSQAWMNPCPLVRMGTLDGTPAKFSVVWKPVRRPVSPARALNPVNWGSHSVYVKEGHREVKVPEVTMHRRKLKPVGDGKAKSVRSRSASRGRSPDRSPRPVSMLMLDLNAPPVPEVPPHSGVASAPTTSSSSPPPNWFKRAARKVFSTSSSGASSPTHTSPGKSPATAAGVLLASAPPRTVSPSRMALLDAGDETECDDTVAADADDDDATLANSTTIRAQVEVPGTPADILHLILDRPAWDAKCMGWDVVFESHFHTTRQYHFSDGIPPTQFVEVTSFKSTSIILSAMALPDLAPTHLTLPPTPSSSSSSSSTHSSSHAWVPTPTSTSSLQSLTLGWVLEPCISNPGQTRVSLYVHARGPDTRGRRRKPFTRSPASIARRAATQVAGWLEQVAVRAVCVQVVRDKEAKAAAAAPAAAVAMGQDEDVGKARGVTTDSGIVLSFDRTPGPLAPAPAIEGLQTATLNRRDSSRGVTDPGRAPHRRLLRSMSDGNLAWLARARFESHHPPSAHAPMSQVGAPATAEWIIRPVDPTMVPTSPTSPTHAPGSTTPPAAAALRDRAQLALVHARRLPGPGGSGKWIAESVALLAGMMKAGWSAVTARLWWGKATHGTTMAAARAGGAEGEGKRGGAAGKAGKLKVKTRGRAVSDVGGGRGAPGMAGAARAPESTVSEIATGMTVEEAGPR